MVRPSRRKGAILANLPTHLKFPNDSATREYDVFEESPDGSTIWRACALGMKDAEIKLEQLAKESGNRFFAVHILDQRESVISRFEGGCRHDSGHRPLQRRDRIKA